MTLLIQAANIDYAYGGNDVLSGATFEILLPCLLTFAKLKLEPPAGWDGYFQTLKVTTGTRSPCEKRK